MSSGGFWGLMFGKIEFGRDEEYAAFRFKFLIVVMWISALCTVALLVGDATGTNVLGVEFVSVAALYTGVSIVCPLALRGRRRLFIPLAALFAVANLVEFTAAFIFVTTDELRLIWFVLSIPQVYVILGRRSGAFAAVFTLVWVPAMSSFSAAPPSANATVTFCLGLAVAGVSYHVYVGRAVSAFERMVELTASLRERAARDPLTDLLNAGAYYDAADAMLSAAARTGDAFAVLFVDLDHFKRVNDEYGHEAGDTVLRSVAWCLRAGVRAGDLVGRVGGEEFSIFLPGTTLEEAVDLAERLRLSVEALMPDVGGVGLRVTASIGVAARLNAPDRVADIQRKADLAMYEAKRTGRNRVTRLA